jgi:hypothetical protein
LSGLCYYVELGCWFLDCMTGTETVLLVETLYYDFIDRHVTLWLRLCIGRLVYMPNESKTVAHLIVLA